MIMKAKLLKTNLDVIEVTPKNGMDFSLEELRGFVGGFIEIVPLSPSQIMVINEEGKLNDLPVNALATNALYLAMGDFCDVIVGDALICDSEMVEMVK